MNSSQILNSLGNIADYHILENQPQQKHFNWVRWTAIAACLALIIGVPLLVSPVDPTLSATHPTEKFDRFATDESIAPSQILDLFDIEDLQLTIYYISPEVLTRFPWNTDNLRNSNLTKSIRVYGTELKNNHVLSTFYPESFPPVEQPSHLHPRLYYILETTDNEKIFDVAFGGENHTVFLNGVPVEANDVFYQIIQPYLTDKELIELGIYFDGSFWENQAPTERR